jgi:uncharacterized damage-inducible protein DinB
MHIETFRTRWRVSRDKSRRIAQAITAENESFRPLPAYRSLGDMQRHLLQAHQCVVTGLPGGSFPWREVADSVTNLPLDAIEPRRIAIDQTLEGLLDDHRNDAHWFDAQPPGGDRSREEWLWALLEHETHHRGQMSLMLRLSGTAPPSIFE